MYSFSSYAMRKASTCVRSDGNKTAMDNTLALTVLNTHIDGIKKHGRLDLATLAFRERTTFNDNRLLTRLLGNIVEKSSNERNLPNWLVEIDRQLWAVREIPIKDSGILSPIRLPR